jgi:hypothetical protein
MVVCLQEKDKKKILDIFFPSLYKFTSSLGIQGFLEVKTPGFVADNKA